MDQMPRVLAYDLEFLRPVPAGDWSRMTECGVSVLASWSSHETDPRVWLPEEGPHIWKNFAKHALEHDVFLTWNGLGCDDRMIHAEFPTWARVLPYGKRVDLCVIAGLYSLAHKKGLDLEYLTGVLAKGVPNNFPELVGYKAGAKVNVMRGWNLEAAYCNTFGLESSKTMAGAEAPHAWGRGEKGAVIGYCVGDAKRLLDLWRHAWKGEELVNKFDGRTKIPQIALGAR